MTRPWPRRLAVMIALGVVISMEVEGSRETKRLRPAQASRAISEMLYEENLISDPEVNHKMNEYVLAVSRDGTRVEVVLPEFHHWLEEWVRRNPDRVAAAKALPRQPRPGAWRE